MHYCLFILLFLMVSCGPKDPQMCDCLESGERLNQLSAKLLNGKVTQAQKDSLLRLRKETAEKCLNYQTMSGEEMLKRKADCQ